ncbi:MAG TPA: hypothetical protein VEL79_22540, partial [Vicinamibacterales bacterium]|nr:hypothetical protein [Vicinamibacterales bacterium]
MANPGEPNMDFTDIECILELMRQHDLAEFEMEREGLKVRVRKAGALPTFHAAPMPGMPTVSIAPPVAAGAPAVSSSATSVAAAKAEA